MATAREPIKQAGYISATSDIQQKSLLRTAAGPYIRVISALRKADKNGILSALKAYRNAIDPVMFNYVGRIVETTGDELLIEPPAGVYSEPGNHLQEFSLHGARIAA